MAGSRAVIGPLPEFELPPVTEVTVAVQFVPIPQFGMREAVAVSRAFEGWEIVDVVPALEPIVESPIALLESPGLRLGLGSPPLRLLLSAENGRWLAQVQQDRVAVHERRGELRPTFPRVVEQLRHVVAGVSGALATRLLEPPHSAELVEVIYDNTIRMGGAWIDLADLHRVLRYVSPEPGEGPFSRVEQAQVGFTYPMIDDGVFAGRLRVLAGPHIVPGEQPAIRLQLVSRRIVGERDLDSVLEQSHANLVEAFTAVTTDQMHELWNRLR